MKSQEIEFKLTIKKVYSSVFKMCMNNFKVFYGLSLLVFLTNMIFLLMSFLRTKIDNILASLLLGILTIFILILSLRFTVSLIISFRAIIKGISMNLGNAIKQSNGYIWNYFKGTLQLYIVNGIPLIMMTVLPLYVEEIMGKVIIISISLALFIYINTYFGYLPYIKVLNENVTKSYGYSKELATRGYKVSVIVLNISVISMLYGIIRSNITGLLDTGSIEYLAYSSVLYIYQLFVNPIIIGGITLSYSFLEQEV